MLINSRVLVLVLVLVLRLRLVLRLSITIMRQGVFSSDQTPDECHLLIVFYEPERRMTEAGVQADKSFVLRCLVRFNNMFC